MPVRDLLRDPLWRAEDLGHPIPDSEHAISVALPTWNDVVDYEEGRPRVRNALRAGYPRFVIHPLLRRLAALLHQRHAAPGELVTVLPSLAVARRVVADLQARRLSVRLLEEVGAGAAALVHSSDAEERLRHHWQHAGWVTSSRQAAAALAGRGVRSAAADTAALAAVLAPWYGAGAEDVAVTANGMRAFAVALAAAQARRPGRPTIQLGFPYVDLLKYQERLGHGCVFVPGHGPEALARVAAELERGAFAACVVETPGNPLLSCVDVPALSAILRRHDTPLIIDDTVATAANLDVTPWADLVIHSLTKYVAGEGDVMGGLAVAVRRSPWHAGLREALRVVAVDEGLWWEDAAVLRVRAVGWHERVLRQSANATALVRRLRAHPAVDWVGHPDACPNYAALRRPGGGHGGLLSFTLRDASRAPAVFDALHLNKGPSLGTTYTLACPFALLAHYRELDWARDCGVPAELIRVAVGLEDPDELWSRFVAALAV
jgi:cystathionine gamma-synthase